MPEKDHQAFRRGVMGLVLLGLLNREDMYGYQMVQEIERLSGGKLTTQEGSLYPVLYRLEEEGCITFHKVQVGKRMSRVYYHLEPKGQQRLQELTQEYLDTTNSVLRIIGVEGGEEYDES